MVNFNNAANYFYSLNYNLKLGYIIFLFLFTIFLLYQNFNQINRNIISSHSKFVHSGPKPSANLFSFLVGITSLHMYIESRFDKWSKVPKLSPEDLAELAKTKQYKQELLNTQAMAEQDKMEYLNKFNRMEQMATNLHQNNSSIQDTIAKVKLINDLKEVKKAQGDNLNSVELDTLNREKEINQTLKNQQENFDNDISELKDLTKKSSIIDLDIRALLDSLTPEELLALANLLFNQIIIFNVFSIFCIFYGDFLIKYFNLELKYPKIANIIQLRKTYQKYFLNISFIWILFSILPQIYVDVLILYSKLISVIFN